MTFRSVNIERLYSQAKLADRLTQVFYGGFLPNYVKDILENTFLSGLKVNVLFDETPKTTEDKTELPHGEQYFSLLSHRLFGSGCTLKPTEVAPHIFSIEVDKSLTGTKEDAMTFLNQVMESRALEFAKGLSIIPMNNYGEPIYPYALFLGQKDYLQYLPKIPDPKKFFTPKTQYRGATTYEVIHYFTDVEKDLLKKQLLDILSNHGVRKTLFAECQNREIAYERLVPPGEEEHQRWRVKLEDYWWVKSEVSKPEDLDKMTILYDILGYYSKLKQNIKTDEGTVELLTKLVLEIDPRFSTIEHVGFIFDKLTRATSDLGLPFIPYHSGSSSPRIHMNTDTEGILADAIGICEDFSFIGAGFNKPIKTSIDAYNVIMRGLADALYLYTYNKTRYYREPNITRNKFSSEYGLCLFDRPTDVSIDGGSAKKIIRMTDKIRKTLQEIDEGFMKIPVTVTICTPLRYNESAPKTPEEILKLCNHISAVERLNDMWPTIERKMGEKITSQHIRNVFKRTPTYQFRKLRANENSFRTKYPKH